MKKKNSIELNYIIRHDLFFLLVFLNGSSKAWNDYDGNALFIPEIVPAKIILMGLRLTCMNECMYGLKWSDIIHMYTGLIYVRITFPFVFKKKLTLL